MARGTLSLKERSLCLVAVLPAWAKAGACPSALHLLCVQSQSDCCWSRCVPAQEPLDACALALCLQHWPSLAELGAILAYSLLPRGPLPGLQGQGVLDPLPSPGKGALCAVAAQLGGLFPARSLCLLLCWLEGALEELWSLSPCVAECLSPEDFSSPALQVPSFPLLRVGTLCRATLGG